MEQKEMLELLKIRIEQVDNAVIRTEHELDSLKQQLKQARQLIKELSS